MPISLQRGGGLHEGSGGSGGGSGVYAGVYIRVVCVRCVYVVYTLCIRCVYVVYTLCIRCAYVVLRCVYVVYTLCIRCVYVVYTSCVCNLDLCARAHLLAQLLHAREHPLPIPPRGEIELEEPAAEGGQFEPLEPIGR